MKAPIPKLASWRYLVTVLALAATYCVAGRLGLLLAIPPGYASGIWPPSGIALAGTLVYGYRVWLGIVLGSFLVNIWTSFDATSVASEFMSVVLAANIGVGAALQALGGAFLVKRCVGFPSPLTRARDIGTFLVLGGPVSCLISATTGVTSLLVGGVIPGALYLFSWLTWWVGDTIGVLIVTPLVLVWTAEPQQLWRYRRLSVALPLTVTLALAIVFFVYAHAWDRDRVKLGFERQAETLTQTLKESFDNYLDVLHAIESLYASSPGVERQGFRTFVQRLLARHPGIQALSWDRRVSDAQRAAYEEVVRQEGYPDFQITEQNAQGQLVRAAQRPEYVVVSYIEPYVGNETALGYDVLSSPDRLEVLHGARDTGEVRATGRIRLVQETGEQPGLLIFLPLYDNGLPYDTVEERRQHLRGYMTGVFRIGDMVEASLHASQWMGMMFQLYDEMAPAGEHLLYTLGDNGLGSKDHAADTAYAANPLGLQRSTTIELAGRRWTLRFIPTLPYLAVHQTWQPWAVLVGGLLFTSLLGGFLLVITGHTATIEQLVARRTTELSQTNVALEGEIVERQRAEVQLRGLLESAPDAMVIVNRLGEMVLVNAQTERRFGYTREELLGQPVEMLMPIRYRAQHPEYRRRYCVEPRVRPMGAGLSLNGLHKDGHEFPVEVSLSPLQTEEGTLVISSIRDITERKQMEEDLRRTAADLARSNADLEQFAYVASHDLQEPLRTVASFTQLLAKRYTGQLDAKADEFMTFIVDGAKRMQQLVEDLLAYSRVGTRDEPLQPTDSTAVLQQALTSLAMAIQESGAQVTSEPLPTVRGMAEELTRLWQNLIGNALKYRSVRPPQVHITVQPQGSAWQFAVQDNGIGFDPHQAERIFGVFQRLHTHKDYPGTGIGLAICRKIIERHGGCIWAEGRPGEGATFYFTLPIGAA